MAVTPIWQDRSVTYATSDNSLDYIIMCDGDVIFSGKAYKRPGATGITFSIGDVCAPFLSSDVDLSALSTEFVAIAEMARAFLVTKAQNGIVLSSVRFSNDWSYKRTTTNFASDPVQRRVDPRQLLVAPLYEASKVIAQIDGDSGQTLTLYDGDSASGLACVDTALLSNATSVTISANTTGGPATMTYEIVKPCSRYVLYYVNAFGGWDSLIVDGTDNRVDNYTRSTYKKVYSPVNTYERGTVNYRNDIERTISLVTGWLTDEESARMHHLFGSTNVYLHDLVEIIIRPVTITATSWTQKTFRNNGCRLVNYTIEVTIAQDFVRQ